MLDRSLQQGRYAVSEFFSGDFVLDAKPGDTIAFGDIPPHSAALVKAEPLADQPVIVSSDAHFGMGWEFEHLTFHNGCLRWKLQKGYDYPAHYRVWIPAESTAAESVISLDFNGFLTPEGSLTL